MTQKTNRSGQRKRTAIDEAVAHNLKIARLARRMSQQELARALGVTFQQVQKYEHCVNRISAGMLVRAARYLGVPTTALLDGTGDLDGSKPRADALTTLGITSDGLTLAKAFNAIKNRRVRAAIVAMVKAVAPEGKEEMPQNDKHP